MNLPKVKTLLSKDTLHSYVSRDYNSLILALMTTLIWATIINASLRISFLSIDLGIITLEDNHLRMFLLNGVPLILLWYCMQHFFHRSALLLAILLFAHLFCIVSTLKVQILREPLIFTDIYEIPNVLAVLSSIKPNVSDLNYLQFIDLLAPLVTWKFVGRKRSHDKIRNRKLFDGKRYFFRMIKIPLVAFIGSMLFLSLSLLFPYSHTILRWGSDTNSLLEEFRHKGALNFFAISGFQQLTKNRRFKAMAPSRESVKKAAGYFSSKRESTTYATNSGMKPAPNVIVILLESMGRAALEAPKLKAAGKNATPFLNSLREDLLFSTNILSPTTGGGTSDCEFVILNSCLNQRQYGFVYTHHMNRKYYGLPAILNEAGYHTAAFHANKKHIWHRVNAYKQMGFDRYDSLEDFSPGRKLGYGLSDDDFLKQMVQKLHSLPEPYFAFIITLTGHRPFSLPKDLRGGVTDGIEGLTPLTRDYLESMSYTDRALKSFWEETADIRERSITVVLGDHPGLSEEGEHKSLGYGGSTDGVKLQGMLNKQVPLIISAPFLKDRVSNVSHVFGDQSDIAPTILYLLGLPVPHYFIGDILFNEKTTSIAAVGDIMDKRRMCSIYKQKYYDFTLNRNLAPEDCEDLKYESEASRIITEDIIWGNRYSYEIQ